MKRLIASVLVLSVVGAVVIAAPVNITIPDDNNPGGTGWYSSTAEDNEVESGMQTGQKWDLEAFFYDDATWQLGMVGGYNFVAGEKGLYRTYDPVTKKYTTVNSNYTFKSGDIFLDDLSNGAGYDYAIDLVFGDTNIYNVYTIDMGTLEQVKEPLNNPASNPWQYNPNGDAIFRTGTFSYAANQNLAFGVNFLEDPGQTAYSHNVISGIDISFLAGKTFRAHFTMECGNDNLMGQASARVPEPGVLMLLGIGLGVLGLYQRKSRK